MAANPPLQHYDVIIIGSGPAGISAALEITKDHGATVAIVESGLLEQNRQLQSLSGVDLSGDLHPDYFPLHAQRRFGGGSTVWGGFCAVLEQRAFSARSWPIDYSELAQWYPAAAAILELPDNAHLRPQVAIAGTPELVYKPFYLSPPVRFNEKYYSFIQQHPNIHLLLGKTCSRLVTQGPKVVQAELLDSLAPTAAPLLLAADHFILACGGLGNPRMLQLSGLAESMPVGQGLMEHPHLYGVAQMYLDHQRIRQVAEAKAHVVHALQLSDEYCLQHDLLSFSADFNLGQEDTTALLGKRQRTTRSGVSIRLEMPPNPSNRITLGAGQDYLGQPRSAVDFHYRCEEQAHDTWGHFSRALLRSGLGRPSPLMPAFAPASGGHLIGTTRMGLSATNSVVDGNCRVHTTDNLYAAGSSIFPEGGASNPTYTIVAMALRLGDHLATILKGRTYG